MGIQIEEISFGTWLRTQRRRLDYSRQALADELGFAEITLRRIENGSLKPSKDLTRLLLDKFDIPKEEQGAWILFARGVAGYPNHSDISTRTLSSLPVFLTKFIGRETEQEDVIGLLNRNRLVTLTGPGGVGKTRLVGTVGEQVQSDYSHGVWMVELAPLRDPALVPQAVCALLGLSIDSQTRYEQQLLNYLRTRDILLILDNCEHLLQACAELADALLKNCPRLKIIATSREPLQIMGEAIYHVPSLGIPEEQHSLKRYRESESIRLFEERARLAQSSFELTLENVAAVSQICRQLDGIPLAIELAAARVDILSVEQIASRLQESFDLLTGGNRTALPRQQTIRGSIDWSWNLLSEEERILLCRLSVFSGGWTLDAAEAVCHGGTIQPQQVAELMTQIAAKSLIVVHQDKSRERRYGLHEIIHQYAREKLDAAEREMIRSQHLQYYLDFSERAAAGITGPDHVEWVAHLHVEMDNVRLALDWAYTTDLDAGSHILSRLHENINLQEGLQWAKQFVESPLLEKSSLARARILQTQADYWWTIEKFTDAKVAAEESLELFRVHGDRIGEFGSLVALGGIYQFLEGMDRKSEVDHRALELARAIGDPLRQAVALSDLGWDRRNNEQALRYWDEAIALFRQEEDWRDLGFLLGIYGDTLLANGDAEAARPLLEEATELSWRTNNRRSLEFVLTARSRMALMSDNFKEAKSYLQEWIETADAMGNRMSYLWARARLGYVLLMEGALEDGAEILCQTAREFHADHNRGGLAFTLERLAHLFAVSSIPERAAQLIGWADKTRADIGDVRPKLDQVNVDSDLAVCVSQLGESQVKDAMQRGRTLTFDEVFALAVETG